MLILADGLYPYEGFIAICRTNQWSYCVTFMDGNLPSVWEEVLELKLLQSQNTRQEVRYQPDGKTVTQVFHWVTGVDYKGHKLNWLSCEETITTTNKEAAKEQPETARFVHITDLPIDVHAVADTSTTGRLRWKIENEGFNTLKNGGYGMEHQYVMSCISPDAGQIQCTDPFSVWTMVSALKSKQRDASVPTHGVTTLC